MPIATPEKYRQMFSSARQSGYAFPAINVTGSETLNGALRGFADAESDGIIQISTGGAEFLSGTAVKEMPAGAAALAEFAHVVAARYPVNVALHTDHCQPEKVDSYIRPLVAMSSERVAGGQGPLFQSHMLDASLLPIEENLQLAESLLAECEPLGIILELEIGIVGGKEDAMDHEDIDRAKLYTSPEDMVRVVEVLGPLSGPRYLLAAVFGNVHGVYKPGAVQLRPEILRDGQQAVEKKFGSDGRHYLVFHGGSGSSLDEIQETLSYGVVKMNIDTDTQYSFTRPIAGHMFTNYDGVLKVDGGVGDKGAYDPRPYMKKGEENMAARVVQACSDLLSAGRTLR
ncbi:MAG TPA: class II fructose-bisphosphate aldolase [Acidimicrobiia bacterium]|nr:class II fructose-bisphosphate aldolase [Acidimicrobiia bacterium]